MIPKTIHYCWFGGKPLPRDVGKCILSWEKHCPDYRIVRWDESNFDVGAHPFTEAAYADGAWAFVSDYARLKVAHDNGGFYLDTDVELLRGLDFLRGHECCIGVQQGGRLCNTGLGFGCAESSPVVHAMLERYDGLEYDPQRKAGLACPYHNNAVIAGLGYSYSDDVVDLPGVTVYPCRYFDPIAPGRDAKNLLCDDTVSIHHYSNSWGSGKDMLRRRAINVFGIERVAAIKGLLHG